MTTELEKQFFDTFGIEPRKVKICTHTNHCSRKYKLCNDDCKHWEVVRTDYPQITDYKLLQLLALCQNKSYEEFKSESFKKIIMIMGNNPYHKHQVQAIFKESEQE